MIKRLFAHRIFTLILAVVLLASLVLLAASIQDMHFQPGRILPQEEKDKVKLSIGEVLEDIVNIPLGKQIVFWALALSLVVVVTLFLPPELRKRIIRYFLIFLTCVLALYFMKINQVPFTQEIDEGALGISTGSQVTPVVEQPVFTPPHISSIQVYLISLVVILTLAVIIYFFSRWWLRKRQPQEFTKPLEDLARIARKSLADISAGGSWEDVIIQCYARMSDVVDEKRGQHRRQDLTPREFAERLEETGLPAAAVRRLTSLFESVRYGARKSTPSEIDEAVSCLTTISRECGVET